MQKCWWLVDVMVCFIIGASSSALFLGDGGDLKLFFKRIEMGESGPDVVWGCRRMHVEASELLGLRKGFGAEER